MRVRMLGVVGAVVGQALEADGPAVDVLDLADPEFAVTAAITPDSIANVSGCVVVFETEAVSYPLLIG